MNGDWQKALAAFPVTFREERRLLEYLLEAGQNYAGAKKRIREAHRKLYFSAYQSYLFNLALARRIKGGVGELRRLHQGDVAYLHKNGALFLVDDPAREEARAARFEISPTGPIFGKRMLAPLGLQAGIEREILAAEGVQPTDFHQLMPKLRLDGGRRPFRVRVEDLQWRIEGTDLHVEFFLPKGCYATTVLRELMKCDKVPEAYYEEGEEEKHGLWRPPAAEPPSAEGEADFEAEDVEGA